jgi:hypothetical protein
MDRDIQYIQNQLVKELEYFNDAVIAGVSIEDMDRLYEILKRKNKQLILMEDALIIHRLFGREDED